MNERRGSLLEYVSIERDEFARYSRAHPRFKRNIAIDALISILLVLTGFGIFNHVTERARLDELMRSGGVVMSSDQLIKHVKSEKIAAYWLGPKPGYRYTIICKDRREIIVTYLPQGVSLNHPDRFNLTVETYSPSLQNEQPGQSNISSDRDDFVTADGTVVDRDSVHPKMVRFSMPETGKLVEVQFPSTARIYQAYVDREIPNLISEVKS